MQKFHFLTKFCKFGKWKILDQGLSGCAHICTLVKPNKNASLCKRKCSTPLVHYSCLNISIFLLAVPIFSQLDLVSSAKNQKKKKKITRSHVIFPSIRMEALEKFEQKIVFC